MKGKRPAFRSGLVMLAAVVAVSIPAQAAWALQDEFTDPNDVDGRFDIRRAFIDVSGSPRIAVFSITTYGRWQARHLLDYLAVLKADFDSRGGGATDYFVDIDAVDRNTITCDLYRRRGRVLVESFEASKGPKTVACSFVWSNIRPAGRVRWRVASAYVAELDSAPDEGFRTI